MKKALSVLLGLTVVAGLCFAQGFNNYVRIFPRDVGPRGSATINDVLTDVGSSKAHIVLTGGRWTITNNVTFPTNVVLEIDSTSYFWITTNNTVTVNSAFIAPADFGIFQGTGGRAAGSADFIYRWPNWGDTNVYNIGNGIIDGGAYLSTTNLYRNGGTILEFTNTFENGGFLVTTNTFSENGGPVVTTNSLSDNLTAIGISSGSGDAVGFWPTYVDTNTITIGVGEVSVAGSSYQSYSVITQDVTGLPNSTIGITYGYLDDSLSTGSVVTVYTATNKPAEFLGRIGYYNSAISNDLVLFAIPFTNSALSGFTCNKSGDLIHPYDDKMACATNMNPNSKWQVPDLAESSTFLPVNASHVYLAMNGDESVQQQMFCAATTYEMTNSFQGVTGAWTLPSGSNHTFAGGAMLLLSASSDTGSGIPQSGWMPLGPSRNVRIAGEDDDENDLGCSVAGWRIYRK